MAVRKLAIFATIAAALAADGPNPHSPNVVLVKGAAPVSGRVLNEDRSSEVIVNIYNSRNPAMTLGVERIPVSKVQKIEETKDPLALWAARAAKTNKNDAAGHVILGNILKDGGLKELAREEFIVALLADAENAAAAKAIGEQELKKLQKSDPRLNAELKTRINDWFACEDGAQRRKLHEAMVKDFNYNRSLLYLERARRSKIHKSETMAKSSRQNDRKLIIRSRDVKGVYTLYVPSGYDPMKPAPLVLGLHGGGRGGKDGKEVVGSGAEAMNFYQNQAEHHGFIVVCPTAIAAPWQQPQNDPLVLAVLEEVLLLFNIDENRIYLTGHSMGGFGAWYFGPKYANLWAAIAPMSGAGGRELEKLKETGMGIYLYHGADDKVVGFANSHQTGEAMRKEQMDFIYTELSDSGHDCPPAVIDECFDFFEAHRLHATPDRTMKGKFEITKTALSSFDRKISDVEREYLGDLLKPAVTKDALAPLLADIHKGGGSADSAIGKIVQLNDPAAPKALITIINDAKELPDARAAAARTLGKLAAAEAAGPLAKIMKDADPALVIACAQALGGIKDKKSVAPLRDALRRAGEFVKSKVQGENTLDFIDYEKSCDLAGAITQALGEIGDPASAPDIVTFPGEGLLLAKYTVDAEARAGQDAAKPRKALRLIVVQALEKLGNEITIPFINKLKSLP